MHRYDNRHETVSISMLSFTCNSCDLIHFFSQGYRIRMSLNRHVYPTVALSNMSLSLPVCLEHLVLSGHRGSAHSTLPIAQASMFTQLNQIKICSTMKRNKSFQQKPFYRESPFNMVHYGAVYPIVPSY